MQAYCVKCRAKKEMKDAKAITMKNGKPATQGICPTCGTKMFRIGKSWSCYRSSWNSTRARYLFITDIQPSFLLQRIAWKAILAIMQRDYCVKRVFTIFYLGEELGLSPRKPTRFYYLNSDRACRSYIQIPVLVNNLLCLIIHPHYLNF